ncbi:ankyrin-3-like [Homarus americanus]|uniref:ankyrin-3-like n=1 Tax=Homarus americanus TaxID=6706 RepID=UPI001C4956E9|nr:ankyrin-3-like [Homarus americanus]
MVRGVARCWLCVGVLVLMTVAVSQAETKQKATNPCKYTKHLPTKKRKLCHGLEMLRAASTGEKKIVQELLNQTETTYLLAYTEREGWRRGFTALLLAAENNHTEVAKLLVDYGSDVNHTSSAKFTVVYLMAENGALDTLKLVLNLSAVADVKTSFGLSPLLIGAWNGYSGVVKALLGVGANPDVKTPLTLYSPLYMAAKAGDKTMANYLLSARADINVVTSWGVTALMTAIVWGHEEVAKLLLDKGADPNLAEKDGFTALHKAAYYRHPNIVTFLLAKNARLDATDNLGMTPLHYCMVPREDEVEAGQKAIIKKKAELIRLLLEKCPDPTITDVTGKTALDLAKMSNSTELQTLLEGYNRSNCN